jgi:hypothetical protein
MRSADQGEAYFKAGQDVHLVLPDNRVIGKGFVRRVLNNGQAYVVKFMDMNFVMSGRAVLPPTALQVNIELYNWMRNELQLKSTKEGQIDAN